MAEKEEIDGLTEAIIGAAIDVHRAIGPGLLESAYEAKAVDQLLPVHQAQMLSYLKLTGCPVGLLMNFHVPVLSRGIRRVVNRYPDSPSDPLRPLRPSALSAVKRPSR